MKLRLLTCLIVFIGLMGGVDLARGAGAPEARSSKAISYKGAAVASPLLSAARPRPIAAMPQGAPPSTGPSPANFLTAGVYQNNSHPNSSGINSLAFGDFNGDGNQDVITVDGSSCISFFPGDGKGSFGTPVDTCFPNRNIAFAAAADFDGDGHLDLAVAATTYGTITLMVAKGNGD